MYGRGLDRSIGAALVALALSAAPGQAQETSEPAQAKTASDASPPTAAGTEAKPAETDSDPVEAPTSTEQGHTQMPESFDHRPLQELLRESRYVGLRDTTFNAQFRSFYLHRDEFNNAQELATTAGGSAGFKTGYFLERVAFGATGYTSQKLNGPLDKDGTDLLLTGQRSYEVVGEAYSEVLLMQGLKASLGRRLIETPYINSNDSRMTPATFQGYTLLGAMGSSGGPVVRFGAGYIDREKDRNSNEFVPMSVVAGAPAKDARGVYAAGAHVAYGDFSIGAIEYYCADIINITYTETRFSIPLADRIRLRLGAQYSSQGSTGADLLTGHAFSADQLGAKTELVLGSALLTIAYTDTSGGASMQNPWGAYPGYTSVQIENFYRAGESAALFRAAYNFPKPLRGLSAYALYVQGGQPAAPKQYAQDEYDLNVQWDADRGMFKGLTLRARYGHVAQDTNSGNSQHQDELRLILYYQLR